MKSLLLAAASILACSSALAGTISLPAKDLVFKSTGAAYGTGGWELKSTGYLGTLVSLPKSAKVKLTITASGKDAVVHIHVGGARFIQKVDEEKPKPFAFTCTLPSGTHWLRVELVDGGKGIGRLQMESLSVAGDGIQFRNVREDQAVLDAADTYIENYRKGSIDLTLTDAQGKRLPAGTQVQLKLRRHAFDFGTAVYGTNPMNADWLVQNPAPGSDAAKYQQFLKSHYNMIVTENAGKWGMCEAERDKETMDLVDSILSFARTNDLRMRMHTVIWGQSLPKWADDLLKTANGGATQQEKDAAKSELRMEITERINTLVRDRAGKYIQLDGINESAHQDGFLKAYGPSGVAGIYNEIIEASANRARVYFNEYCLFQWNQQFGYKDEYGNWYKDHIEKIISSGIDPGNLNQIGIGMQYYPSGDANALKNSPHSPVRIAQTLKLLDVFEYPMSLTEFDVQADSQQYAPRYLADTMRLVFGNDQSTSFLMWGFWKKHMWLRGAALVDENWNLTDCGKTYEQLLGIHDWGIPDVPKWTTDLTLKTDRRGKVSFKGFYGDYEITSGGAKAGFSAANGKAQYAVSLPR